jgi:hypothetical protein
MRCKSYEKWIYLYREGELTLQEKNKIKQHLATCGNCRQLEKRIRQLEEATGTLRMEHPVLPEGESLTDDILNSVRPLKTDKHRVLRGRRPLHLHWIFVGAALVLAAAFLMQQSWVYLKVSQLENRMAGMEAWPQKDLLSSLTTGTGQLRRLSGLRHVTLGENGNTKDEYVVIKREVLEALLQTNRVLNQDRLRLITALNLMPEFSEIDFQDGLNFEEWRILAKNQHSIIKHVRRYQ